MINKYLCFIATMLLVMVLVPFESSANSYIPKKRVVVIVYDDSGSMWGKYDENGNEILIDNWKYANFSLQSFVGLLDDGDQLIIIPMSDPNKRFDINISKSKRAKSIEATKQIQGKGNTPISTIESAVKHLEQEMALDKNAEFWMIVLTDGIFNELNRESVSAEEYERQKEETEGILRSFKKNIINERVLFRSVLVTIESYLSSSEKMQMEKFKKMWDQTLGGEFIEGKNGEDILNKMQQVAALITNRDPNNKHGYELPATYDKKRLLLESPFPLRRITLLQQSINGMEPVSIKQVTINGSSDTHLLDGPIVLKTMEDPQNISADLFSYITHLKHNKPYSVLPAGTYEITFKQHTKNIKDSLLILAEPAINFTVNFYKQKNDGTLIDDDKQFFIGDDMQVEVTLFKSGSENEVLDLSSIGNISNLVSVTTKIGDENVSLIWDEKQSKFIGTFRLADDVDFSTTTLVNIKGFYYKEKDKQLPRKLLRNLSFEMLTDGWYGKIDELDKANPLKVLPTVNGKPMSDEELAHLFARDNVKIGTGNHKINAKIEREGNVIVIKPLPYKIAKLTSAGDVLMTLSLEGDTPYEKAEVQFTITIEDIPFFKKWGPVIIGFVFLILLILLGIGYIIKPRFKRNSEYMEYSFAFTGTESEQHTSTQRLQSNFVSRYLVPYFPEKCQIDNLTFKATKNGIVLPKEQQRSDMEVGGRKLHEEAGENDIPLYANDQIKFEDFKHIYTYQYKKN